MGQVPSLAQSSEAMRRHWDGQRYPKLVYVETTNFCNARCEYCLYERMERPVEHMSLDDFKRVADKVKQRGLKIGAMFCFGEPLADRTLFEKIHYGKAINVMKGYLGLNTNCSLLTSALYDKILGTCGNMTLSFVNTGEDFERLTKLSWDRCYTNAIKFIKYRDQHRPDFKIQIGCNDVGGHDRGKVQAAFRGYNIAWARDAEIQWGAKVITGVIDRSIMYHSWTCDGYKGAVQVKPNGDLCFCAYDVIRNETRFANIYEHSWEEVEQRFKQRWREPSSLCLRCDFWWNYKQMVAGGWKRGPHIDDSWQGAYLGGHIDEHWKEQHREQNIRYLTGSNMKRVAEYLGVSKILNSQKDMLVLNVGVGTGRCTRDLVKMGHTVDVLDVCEEAMVTGFKMGARTAIYSPEGLGSDQFDLAISNLVCQHMTDIDLFEQMVNVLRSLKEGAPFAVQYASPTKPGEVFREDLEAQKLGLVRRTKEHFQRLVEMAGGKVVWAAPTKYFDLRKATDDACWNGVWVRRERLVKPIGGL